MCGRETVKARSGGRARGAGARIRGLRRAFAANEGFGGHFAAKGGCVFSVIPYIAHFGGVLQIYKPKERAGGEKQEKIGQKGGERKRNGAEVLAVIIIKISVFEYRGKKSGRLV